MTRNSLLAAAASIVMAATGSAVARAEPAGVKNIVLVHGAFADGSGWKGVYDLLKKDGYSVTIIQNPTVSLADDVAVTKRAIAALDGPVVLVGHSYGGAVVSEAGTDEKVKSLVYVAAFTPDKGESIKTLIANPPKGAPVPPILPSVDGFLFLDKAKFAQSFAADVDPDTPVPSLSFGCSLLDPVSNGLGIRDDSFERWATMHEGSPVEVTSRLARICGPFLCLYQSLTATVGFG